MIKCTIKSFNFILVKNFNNIILKCLKLFNFCVLNWNFRLTALFEISRSLEISSHTKANKDKEI